MGAAIALAHFDYGLSDEERERIGRAIYSAEQHLDLVGDGPDWESLPGDERERYVMLGDAAAFQLDKIRVTRRR
jgi:hypothetical protein